MPPRARCSAVAFLLAACLSLLVSGCAGLGLRRPTGTLAIQSVDGTKALAPAYSTTVYVASDVAAAEIYLTDLPKDRLLDLGDDLSGLSGSIVQVRLFIVPSAGNTPIGNTGCNITMRHLVLSSDSSERPPEVGLYGGGGFLFPGNEPGASTISGTMAGVTLRPLASTPAFLDLLGVCEATGGFTARQDAKAARGLGTRVQKLLDRTAKTGVAHNTSMASPKE